MTTAIFLLVLSIFLITLCFFFKWKAMKDMIKLRKRVYLKSFLKIGYCKEF